MRRVISFAVAGSVVLSAVLALPAQPASATAQCTFTPVLPKRVSIGQSVVGLRAALTISGDSRCSDDFSVTSHLVRSSDEYFLLWDKPNQPDVESVYAFEVVPGTYRTTAGDCAAFDADFNELTCAVTTASTVIKFAAHPRMSIVRKKSKLTFTVRATRYGANSPSTAMTARVSIQRLTSGKWRTVHTATAKGRAGYTWSHVYPKTARYRVVSAETAAAFAGTSSSVRR